MEVIQRLTHHRLCPISSSTGEFLRKTFTRSLWRENAPNDSHCVRNINSGAVRFRRVLPLSGKAGSDRRVSNRSSNLAARAGWFLGLGEKKEVLPDIVKAGDPVLHEPAQEVPLEEIGSERIQKIIDDMIKVMRKAPGVGLAAPQIGIPLKVSELFHHFFFFFLSPDVRLCNVKY